MAFSERVKNVDRLRDDATINLGRQTKQSCSLKYLALAPRCAFWLQSGS